MSESKTPTPEPMTDEQLDAYLQLAENIRDRFGDNWQLVDDEDMDEVSVRTEDSTLVLFTEMFVTSQVHGEDPLEVAGFLGAAIDYVPRMAARIRRAEDRRDRLADQVKRVRDLHEPVCGGACGLDDACECEDRDLVCAEDNDRCPCPTIRALDGTEAAQS